MFYSDKKTKIFCLSKSNEFCELVFKTLDVDEQSFTRYDRFAEMFLDVKLHKPSMIVVDGRTANISTEVCETFGLSDFNYISCVVYVSDDEQESPASTIAKIIFCNVKNLPIGIGKALISSYHKRIELDSENTKNKNTYKKADIYLERLGFSNKHTGTLFLTTVFEQIDKNGSLIANLNSMLYPRVAEVFNTTVINVERNIRNSISKAYNHSGKSTFEAVLNITIKTHVFSSNRIFISALWNVLNKMLDSQNQNIVQ